MTNRTHGAASVARSDSGVTPFDEPHISRDCSIQTAVRWRFYRGDKGLWHWQKIGAGDVLTARSSSAFASLETCEKDAVGAGYRPLAPTAGLMPLSLVRPAETAAAPQVPNARGLGRTENRSTVLKKRIAHPAIERIFSGARTTPSTRRRTPAYGRGANAVPAKRSPPGPHGKSRLSRA